MDGTNVTCVGDAQVPDYLQHRPEEASPDGAVEVDKDEHDTSAKHGAIKEEAVGDEGDRGEIR